MPDEKRDLVKVACMVPNGVMIRLSKPGYDDGTGDGAKMPGWDGPGIRLNGPAAVDSGVGNTDCKGLEPGVTEIESGWWSSWLEQHKLDPLVTMEQVYLLKEEPKENPTT